MPREIRVVTNNTVMVSEFQKENGFQMGCGSVLEMFSNKFLGFISAVHKGAVGTLPNYPKPNPYVNLY